MKCDLSKERESAQIRIVQHWDIPVSMTYPDISRNIPKKTLEKTDRISRDNSNFYKKQLGYPGITQPVTYPWISQDKYDHPDLKQLFSFLRWKSEQLV